GHAADHDENLQGDRERQPRGEELSEVVLAGDADPDAAADEDHVEAQDREQTDEAELFAEAGDDVVALGERRDRRAALPESGADQAAVGEAEDALDELEAGAAGVDDVEVERVQPV